MPVSCRVVSLDYVLINDCTPRLRLLQATIVGVVLLRLLLVPACAFIAGGARVASQDLHPHLADLNQTLLTTGFVFARFRSSSRL